MHHLECLSVRFVKIDNDNERLVLGINNLPDELKTIILSKFLCTQIKRLSHHYIDKDELHSMSDKNNRAFTRSIKTIRGRSKAWKNLEIISDILISAFFNETYYDLVMVFNSQMGFEPSSHYLQKLEKIFPTNKLFQTIDVREDYIDI